jgi:hypothetical protein
VGGEQPVVALGADDDVNFSLPKSSASADPSSAAALGNFRIIGLCSCIRLLLSSAAAGWSASMVSLVLWDKLVGTTFGCLSPG